MDTMIFIPAPVTRPWVTSEVPQGQARAAAPRKAPLVHVAQMPWGSGRTLSPQRMEALQGKILREAVAPEPANTAYGVEASLPSASTCSSPYCLNSSAPVAAATTRLARSASEPPRQTVAPGGRVRLFDWLGPVDVHLCLA